MTTTNRLSFSLPSRHVLVLTALLATTALLVAPVAADELSLAKGSWVKKTQSIAGHWQIVERGGERFLVADDQFKTRKAPDLKIVFSPRKIDDVDNKTALSGSRILAPLPTLKGHFEVKLPADLDLGEYASVLIHCEQYSKLWGGADLR